MIGLARRLWHSIREPRTLRVALAAGYATIAAGGLLALINPPNSIEGAIGPILVLIWGTFLTVGGACGSLSIWPGTWWLEKIGLTLLSGGLTIYVAVTVYLHIGGSAGSNRLTQALIVTGLSIAALAVRGLMIRGLSYEPRDRR